MRRDERTLAPIDHAEEVALFRSEIIGALTRRELGWGELAAELEELSRQAFRLPGQQHTRTLSFPTLERWYYAYKRRGLEGLKPCPRSDRGKAKKLTEEQRTLLLDIRRENPSTSVAVILRTLVADGRLAKDAVSKATVRRLYREHGLDRASLSDGKIRLRWQAERPGALWHGDVCHGPALCIEGRRYPLRIHGLMDDCSRFVVALEAHHAERERDMLDMLVAALRRFGAPDALYLDNGATYRGEALRIVCERLGITLLHARPYDPRARGKMERFWKTLRLGCLDHLGSMGSLHDVQVRLHAFLDQHYHTAPHGGLIGRSPLSVWGTNDEERNTRPLTEEELRRALTIRSRRRVRRDSTVSVDGTVYEATHGFLAGRLVNVAQVLTDPGVAPWIELEDGQSFRLVPVNPTENARRQRAKAPPAADTPTPFDPAGALLDQAAGRPPRFQRKERA